MDFILYCGDLSIPYNNNPVIPLSDPSKGIIL